MERHLPNLHRRARNLQAGVSARRRISGLETLERRTLLAGTGAAAAFDYLSDLKHTVATNGFGPVELDRANGELASQDGRKLKLNGARYSKGIGVHAESEVRYALAGAYRNFISDVGIDDEVGPQGSAMFQVWGDDVLLFDSGVLTGVSRSRRVNVDVSGRNELRLVVTDAGNGPEFDHADWAGARLVKPVGQPPQITMPDRFALRPPMANILVEGRFIDDGPGPWTATVNYGDGTGEHPLALDPAMQSFTLSHDYASMRSATHEIAVRISDGNATGLARTKVVITNNAPYAIGLLGTDSQGVIRAKAGVPLLTGASFLDDEYYGIGEYTFAVDYGDGTPLAIAGSTSRHMGVEHIYARPGVYTVTTTVTDPGGEIGSGTNTVRVLDPEFQYVARLEPSARAGATPALLDTGPTGRAMKINGQKFLRGIGVTAHSELVYDLAPDGSADNYERLIGSVGVDDAAGAVGSVVFAVFADDVKIFDSGVMTGMDGAMDLNVDVRGVSMVKLVVSDAGDGSQLDYADWASLRLIRSGFGRTGA